MQKILCPIDFSKTSLNALEFAARIGEKHQATITLLYIFTEEEHRILLRDQKDVSFDEWRLKTEDKLQSLIDEVKATSLKKGLRDCHFMLKQGDLVKGIKEAVAESGAHFIVMGTTGVSDITEAYVGSNTVQVIQKTTCPVLCVPDKASYKKDQKGRLCHRLPRGGSSRHSPAPRFRGPIRCRNQCAACHPSPTAFRPGHI